MGDSSERRAVPRGRGGLWLRTRRAGPAARGDLGRRARQRGTRGRAHGGLQHAARPDRHGGDGRGNRELRDLGGQAAGMRAAGRLVGGRTLWVVCAEHRDTVEAGGDRCEGAQEGLEQQRV
ncbi:hypothetical protein [Methylobacterium gregans]|uniref:hypothetical protein n=1 Tax=Methylobacterium gregans TaxID=374424 RepID=UPI0036101C4A